MKKLKVSNGQMKRKKRKTRKLKKAKKISNLERERREKRKIMISLLIKKLRLFPKKNSKMATLQWIVMIWPRLEL